MLSLISPAHARRIALDLATLLPVERVAHREALSRTLAEDIHSEIDLPPFDNSAMDGYALVSDDISRADTTPKTLRVGPTIGAGDVASQPVTSGYCLKIMTGAPLPEGADAVVMHEATRALPDSAEVEFQTAARAGQNIRRRGSDVRRGECVMESGSSIRAAEWSMLAALGCSEVAVFRRPRVAIIVTGEELVEAGAPLKAGQIYDSNSFALEALARDAGAKIVTRQRVGDEQSTLEATLRELAAHCDVIVTSGGVSAGDFDPVRDVLLAKARVHFWKIAMKPGKPVLFASFSTFGSDGARREVPIWGLPGNPVSVMVSFELLVRPFLLQMQGRRALHRVQVEAIIDGDLRSPAGKTEYVRAHVLPFETGWKAIVSGDQGSGRLSTMTRANALLVVPSETTMVASGQTLMALMTDWPEILADSGASAAP